MLNEVIENTERFIASVPKAKRKKYGQFFTNSTTAKFMASLFCFDLSKQKIEFQMQEQEQEFLLRLLSKNYMNLDMWGKYMLHAMKQMNQ